MRGSQGSVWDVYDRGMRSEGGGRKRGLVIPDALARGICFCFQSTRLRLVTRLCVLRPFPSHSISIRHTS